MSIAEGLLWFASACYLLSLSVVMGGNALGALSRPRRPLDETQATALGAVQHGLLSRAWGQLVEAVAQVLTVTVDVMRTLYRRPRPGDFQRLESGTPVLVCPGYMETCASMWFLAHWLRRQGFRAVPVEYPSTFAPIQQNADYLRKRIEEILEETGADEVAIVGHSMGGLIARCMMLSHPGDHHVRHLVCFASPHRGVTWSVGAQGSSVRDMTVGSAHMSAFPISARCGVGIDTVVGRQDQIANPVWSVMTEEGHNVVIARPVGHMAVLFTAEARQLAHRWLLDAGVELADGR